MTKVDTDWNGVWDGARDEVSELKDDIEEVMNKDDSEFVEETIRDADGDLPGEEALEED